MYQYLEEKSLKLGNLVDRNYSCSVAPSLSKLFIDGLGQAGGLSASWLFFWFWFNTAEWDWSLFLPPSHTHTHLDVPYVGVVQYTGSSSSRRRFSWSRKEFGDSQRLATLMPPWLRDASSPDKAPVSSLRQTHVHQSQNCFFFPWKHTNEDTLPGCVRLSRWRRDVKVLEGGALGGCAWGCGRTAARASGWLQKVKMEMIGAVNFFFFFAGFRHL